MLIINIIALDIRPMSRSIEEQGLINNVLYYSTSREVIMSKQEIYEEMAKLWQAFDAAHNSTKKKDAAAARKAAGGIKKLVTPYNQASVAESKS